MPIAWFLLRTARDWREGRYLMIAAWFAIPFVFFTMVTTKMDTYTLFAAPSIFIMSAAFIAAVGRITSRPSQRLLRAVVLALLIGGPAYQLSQTIEPFRPENTCDGDDNSWAVALRSIRDRVSTSKAVIFNTRPIETMFYTAAIGYAELPTGDQIDDLRARGYSVNILDAAPFPADLRADPRVTIIEPHDP